MSYTALYRKFRPDAFSDVKGQDHIVTTLKNQLRANRIGHAYLFTGTRGTGKTTVAKIFAKTVNCEHPTEDGPCGECRICKAIAAGASMNVIEIDAASNNGVDNIREIIDEVSYSPAEGKYKVYIIDEVHMLSTSAFNALLKTLEEPPEYAVIMLLTSNVNSLLPTILSRCVVLNMKPVADELVRNYLMHQLQVPDYKAEVCVAFARGNIGKAKSLASSEDFDNIKNEALSLLKYIQDMDLSEITAAIKKITEYKLQINDYLDLIAIWYRDVLLFKATSDVNHLVFREEISAIRRVAQRSSYEGIEEVIEALDKAKRRLDANVNFDLTMELLMLEIKENG